MPQLPMPPAPPDKVFGLAMPHHMLWKLRWEIAQLRSILGKPCQHGAEVEPAYHAFNCAVTAWHMADWIWQSISKEERAEVLLKLHFDATGRNQDDFKTFTRSMMKQYRTLHICHQIAIGSKHKIIESYSDPELAVEEQWHKEPGSIRSRIEGGLALYSIRLVIRDGDVSRPALEVFEEAAQTWDRWLRQWGYFEARYVGGPR